MPTKPESRSAAMATDTDAKRTTTFQQREISWDVRPSRQEQKILITDRTLVLTQSETELCNDEVELAMPHCANTWQPETC